MADFQFNILTDDNGADDEEMAMQGLVALEAAIGINQMYFRRRPDAVCALACGMVRYDTANKNVLSLIAEIKTAAILIRTGIGLCIDIVAFDVAARRNDGMRAWPVIIPSGGGIFHVVTEMEGPGGETIQYDPSEELERLGLAVSNQSDQCRVCAV